MRCVFYLLLICTSYVEAQTIAVSLSDKHQKKLSSIESGHKRMKKYYKFFKADSTRSLKKYIRQSEAIRKEMRMRNVEFEETHISEWDSYRARLRVWKAMLQDSTVSDSIKMVARDSLRHTVLERARSYPGYEHLQSKYLSKADSISWDNIAQQIPGLDTLAGLFQNDPKGIFAELSKPNPEVMQGIGSMGNSVEGLSELGDLTQSYAQVMKGVHNRDSVLTTVKDLAAEKVMEYFERNPAQLEAATQKVSRLLDKYSSFSNSDNLSDARKRSSLMGKPLVERLAIGGTFNVVSLTPLSLDLSPQLGYKFTSRLFAGVGMSYRISFSDSIKNQFYVTPYNTSLTSFVSYDVLNAWYAYFEYGLSEMKGKGAEVGSSDEWKSNAFIGVGRRLVVSSKLYMTVTALYNLNNEPNNPVHPRRFQFRVGFQLSELAIRGKKINFDPNR